jgi:hypothetical protein
MQCDPSTHFSGLSFEHLKTTYQVLLLLPSAPARHHRTHRVASPQRALTQAHLTLNTKLTC